jgi:hypothetical protein
MTEPARAQGSWGESSATTRTTRAIAAVVLLGLFVGGLATPASAEPVDDGAGVEIGVLIEPRADCAAVRPPCRCDAEGTPTLPPGLAKKPMLPPGLAEKAILPLGHTKKAVPRDWCAPRPVGAPIHGPNE